MLDFPNGDTKFRHRHAPWIRSLIPMSLIHLSPRCWLLLVGRGLRKHRDAPQGGHVAMHRRTYGSQLERAERDLMKASP